MTAHRRPLPSTGILRVEQLLLSASDTPWPLAVENAAAIGDHFARRKAANPSFYDGEVFVLRDVWLGPSGIQGQFSLERFSSFLYWRDGLAHDGTTLDGFGSALVRSSEGHVLGVKASTGTLNAGRVYLPGGFIDRRDVRSDRTIDIDASIARELAEETGLDAGALRRVPGYIVARHGRHCCFCIEFRSPLAAEDLRAHMVAGITRDRDRELTDVIVIRDARDLERHDVLDHARLVAANVLETPV
jgi:ADP-ribose pyrophosphatase YjhB (NUDIX family)